MDQSGRLMSYSSWDSRSLTAKSLDLNKPVQHHKHSMIKSNHYLVRMVSHNS